MKQNLPKSLIEPIYDGNLDDLLSPQVAALLCDSFSGVSAAIIRNENQQAPSIFSHGANDDYNQQYEAYFYKLNPMASRRRTPNSVVRMSDLVSKSWFENSEFYNDFLKNFGVYHSMSTARYIGHQTSIELAVGRRKLHSDFTIDDKQKLTHVITLFSARVGLLEAKQRLLKKDRTEKIEALASLSQRELELFLHIANKGSITDFQNTHNISANTARTLAKSMRLKLNADSQLDVAKYAQAVA